jgi:CubicO group peptidase (beta-lactamase class C family)
MRLSTVLSGIAGVLLALPLAAAPEVKPPANPPTSVVPPELTPKTGEAKTAAAIPGVALQTGPANLTRADLEAWLDGFMPYALENGDIAGSVVVVVKDGQVLLQKGYGYSDLAKRTPVDPEATLFRPGSISKLFTWTAVMQLVEQGKLDLDADVNKYIDFQIPALEGKPVTLRQVMTHTTGLEEQIRGLIASNEKEITPLGEALKHWVPERIHQPGATPAYSNYATAMAGYIVQRVSGEPFDQYIDRHILAPLGMRHSSFSQPLQPNLLKQVSRGYERASEGKARPYEFISLAPAGSLAATGSDMGRFMIAHLQNGAFGDTRILGADTAVKMHSTGQASVGPLNRMMLGFYETTMNGHRAISHGGDTQWFHSDLQLFLDDGVGVFVSVNSAGREGASGHIRSALMEEFTDRYLPGPKPSGAGVSAADAKLHARQIAGTYLSSRRPESNFMSLVYLLGPTKVSVNEDGTISVPMFANASGAPKKWREIAPYVWQDAGGGGDRLAADVADGKVTRFSAEPYASIMVFERMPWWHSPVLLLSLLVFGLAVLALTVLAWPISALVRRHYGAPYKLQGADARAHRTIRIVSLVVLATMLAMLGLVLSMMSSFELMGPGSDWMIVALRLLATVAFPVGAVLALRNAWQVLRSRRRVLAKGWAVVLALACVALLWVGIVCHVIGYSANY